MTKEIVLTILPDTIDKLLADCSCDNQFMKLLDGSTKPLTIDEARSINDKILRGANSISFGVKSADERLIGCVGLTDIIHKDRKAKLVGYIGPSSIWDQGWGTTTVGLILKYGFFELNLNRIYLYVYEYNDRARKVYSRAGFIEEGVARQDRYVDGKYWNAILMGILRKDFEEKNPLITHL